MHTAQHCSTYILSTPYSMHAQYCNAWLLLGDSFTTQPVKTTDCISWQPLLLLADSCFITSWLVSHFPLTHISWLYHPVVMIHLSTILTTWIFILFSIFVIFLAVLTVEWLNHLRDNTRWWRAAISDQGILLKTGVKSETICCNY